MEIKKQIEMMFKEKEQTAVVMPLPPKVNRTGANYFVCRFEGCGATIKHRRNLVRHWCLHQKAKYYCFTCGYQSMNREQITQHHCDPNTQGKFDCDECEKHFTILQHLNRHLLLIHGSRLFIWCPTCRSYFARIDALKKHQSRCHQSDSAGGSSLISAAGANRSESGRSIANISAIGTPTITSAKTNKNNNTMGNSTDRIISTVISSQQHNGQMVGMPSNSRDENHFTSNPSAAKQQTTSIINLNHNALNSNQIPLPSNGPNENLFRTSQGALINKGPILIDNVPVGNAFANNLALVRNSVISRGSTAANMMHMDAEQLQLQNTLNDNRIKLLNSNIILSNNNKVQQYIAGTGTGVNTLNNNNDGSNLYNLDAIRDDYSSYIYRNKKRFGELGLQEKDRVFKH